MTKPKTFEEFWPDYLRAHSDERNRTFHILGTALGLGSAALFIATGMPRWSLAAAATGYGAAWAGHAFFEKNKPKTLSHPLWSFRADMRMLSRTLTGRLDEELARIGIETGAQPQRPDPAMMQKAAVAAGRLAAS